MRSIDFDAFYKEVSRTIKNNGILAVIGYGPLTHYQKKKHTDPVALIKHDLKNAWGSAPTQKGNFPILLRVAKIEK